MTILQSPPPAAHSYFTPTPTPRAKPMPPAISDDESDGDDVPEEIPAKAMKASDQMDEDEDEDEEGSDAADDEYVVENIITHRFLKNALQYRVKWLGYDDEADVTWEPLENLKTATVKLAEYHSSLGLSGPPTKGASSSTKKLTSKRSAAALDSPAPISNKKSRSSTGVANGMPAPNRELPKGSWEDEITRIISIIEETETKGKGAGKKGLMAYADWKDEVKRKHKLSTLRGKAPQHLLDYYERHLVFRTEEDPAPTAAET